MQKKIILFIFVLICLLPWVPVSNAAFWGNSSTLRKELVTGPSDPNVAFADSAAADTQKTYTKAMPDDSVGEYELDFYNPSTVTDLTVKVMAVLTLFGGGTRYGYITSFSIPKSQTISGTTVNTYTKYVEGIFNGTACQLIISNDTQLGGSDGFTCTFRMRAVK